MANYVLTSRSIATRPMPQVMLSHISVRHEAEVTGQELALFVADVTGFQGEVIFD